MPGTQISVEPDE